jgi:ribonuclease-3
MAVVPEPAPADDEGAAAGGGEPAASNISFFKAGGAAPPPPLAAAGVAAAAAAAPLPPPAALDAGAAPVPPAARARALLRALALFASLLLRGAALAAALAAAAARRAAAAAAAAPLAAWRLLPYAARAPLSLARAPWPPALPAPHAAPGAAAVLAARGDAAASDAAFAAAGADARGRWAAPLADLPRWRVEALVRTGVRDVSLYRAALTHSKAVAPGRRCEAYEQLEFLGDAVLELLARQALLARLPSAPEGELTRQAQRLVAGPALASYALWLGLDRWLLRNAAAMRADAAAAARGDADGAHAPSPGVLGDAFEALLGAVYLDAGLPAARRFLLRVLAECPAAQDPVRGEIADATDWKGRLAAAAAARAGGRRPAFVAAAEGWRPCGATGRRRRWWAARVALGGRVLGSGAAFDRGAAEQAAARAALAALEAEGEAGGAAGGAGGTGADSD